VSVERFDTTIYVNYCIDIIKIGNCKITPEPGWDEFHIDKDKLIVSSPEREQKFAGRSQKEPALIHTDQSASTSIINATLENEPEFRTGINLKKRSVQDRSLPFFCF
jgi:hypothetical protein